MMDRRWKQSLRCCRRICLSALSRSWRRVHNNVFSLREIQETVELSQVLATYIQQLPRNPPSNARIFQNIREISHENIHHRRCSYQRFLTDSLSETAFLKIHPKASRALEHARRGQHAVHIKWNKKYRTKQKTTRSAKISQGTIMYEEMASIYQQYYLGKGKMLCQNRVMHLQTSLTARGCSDAYARLNLDPHASFSSSRARLCLSLRSSQSISVSLTSLLQHCHVLEHRLSLLPRYTVVFHRKVRSLGLSQHTIH
jgi:hypothetical protein